MRGMTSVLVLTLVSSLGCVAQESRSFVCDVVRQWDSAAMFAPLLIDRGVADTNGYVREWIRYEFDVLDHSAMYSRMESYVDQTVSSASYIIRVTSRLDHPGKPDTVYLRDHKLIRIYSIPPSGGVWWIIGNGNGALRVIFSEDGSEHITDTVLSCALPLLDSLKEIDCHSYDIAPAPDWASVVSVWSPNFTENIYTFGLSSRKFREGHPYFEKFPRSLQWVARLVWDRRCE